MDKVGVEPTSRGGPNPALPSATYPYGGPGWTWTSNAETPDLQSGGLPIFLLTHIQDS